MSEPDFAKLRSTDALVCRRHVAGEMGGATVWYVCLADGFLIECGLDGGLGEARARALANIINYCLLQDTLTEAGLDMWRPE